MARFAGWPLEALEFFEGLAADNTKSYWTANKDRYERDVRGPMVALAAAVEAEFGPLHLFRPYRDVRFSKDKSPYKTHLGAVTEGEGGEMYYVQVGADGLMAASGYYHLAPDQLERFRAAVDDDRSGPAVVKVCTALEAAGYELGAHSELKTAPRGFARDHPRVGLLRRKGLIAFRHFAPGPWLPSAAALEHVVGAWRGAAPLHRWLNTHVGPSTLAPAEGMD